MNAAGGAALGYGVGALRYLPQELRVIDVAIAARVPVRVPARRFLPFLFPALLPAQVWQPLDLTSLRHGHVAHDGLRGRAVLVDFAGEVWEIAGREALHRAVADGSPRPVPRSETAMVHDPVRGHVLLFGGRGRLATLGDTWAWDGLRWRQFANAVSPPRRSSAAMVFDPVRQRVLLHGGEDGNAFPNDTWEHDGAQWLLRQPATVPAALASPRLCYDPVRSVAVLAGTPPFGPDVQLYEWDGTDWRQPVAAGSVPAARVEFGFAFDPLRARAVLVGGPPGSDVVWEWDGTAWTRVGPVPELERYAPATWFDSALGRVIVAGGRLRDAGTAGERSDLWSWDGAAATPVADDRTPPRGLFSPAWFHDPSTGDSVLFGGRDTVPLDQTAIWHGTTWERRTVPGGPAARAGASVASDRAGGRALLFGGVDLQQRFGDLWQWRGGAWSALPGTPGPSARVEAAMAFDEGRGVLVLFGGSDASGLRGDTWEWNGAWTQRFPPLAPSPRTAVMAFDAGRGRTVLFGGFQGSVIGNDTWEWDGSQWRQVAVAAAPPASPSVAITYDRQRGRVVLVETQLRSNGSGVDHDQGTWAYDGATWTLLLRRNAAGAPGLVYDEARQRVLACDGVRVEELTALPAAVAVAGSPCGSAPRLFARTRPRIGEPAFGLEVATVPGSAVLMALSGSLLTTPIGGGCDLEIGPVLATVFHLADARGLATQPIPLPLAVVLRGLTLHGQAGVLDPATGVVSLTAALSVTVGD